MKRILIPISVFLYLVIFNLPVCLAQKQNTWKDLADVDIKTKTDDAGFEMEVPEFGPKPKALEGKAIELSGYMVPLEELTGHKYFVLSAYPFNMCFFCGMAGPETVIEVYSKTNIDYTSDKIKMKGNLKLNRDDAEHLMYILEDAELVD